MSDETHRARVAAVNTERDLAQITLDRATAEANPQSRLTDEKIAAFADLMRANVTSGEITFHRAYIRSVIDQVEVDDAAQCVGAPRNGRQHASRSALVLFASGAP